MSRFVFTSESVAEGHPDKVCDTIADSILDAHLAQDPEARVACEVLCKDGTVVLAGEITSRARVDHAAVARATDGRRSAARHGGVHGLPVARGGCGREGGRAGAGADRSPRRRYPARPRPDFAGKEHDWPRGGAPVDAAYATTGGVP